MLGRDKSQARLPLATLPELLVARLRDEQLALSVGDRDAACPPPEASGRSPNDAIAVSLAPLRRTTNGRDEDRRGQSPLISEVNRSLRSAGAGVGKRSIRCVAAAAKLDTHAPSSSRSHRPNRSVSKAAESRHHREPPPKPGEDRVRRKYGKSARCWFDGRD